MSFTKTLIDRKSNMSKKKLSVKEFKKQNAIYEILESFGKEKRIFQNEAQFQHELAIEIANNYLDEDTKVILELSSVTNVVMDRNGKSSRKKDESDIIIKNSKGEYIVVELKYKTIESSYGRNIYGDIDLSYQGAADLGKYDYLKDIYRIEQFKEQQSITFTINPVLKKYIAGYAIILTNENKYWLMSKELSFNNTDMNYCITDNDAIDNNIQLEWQIIKKKNGKEVGNGKPFKQRPPLQFRNKYKFKWLDYCDIQNKPKFRYLITNIK